MGCTHFKVYACEHGDVIPATTHEGPNHPGCHPYQSVVSLNLDLILDEVVCSLPVIRYAICQCTEKERRREFPRNASERALNKERGRLVRSECKKVYYYCTIGNSIYVGIDDIRYPLSCLLYTSPSPRD